jgi:hypothetical protein
MSNENEDTKGPAAAGQPLREAPESKNRHAEARHEVYNPKNVSENAAGHTNVNGRANIQLAFELHIAGMPAGLVMLFMWMLWKASPTLDWPVGTAGIAKGLKRHRQAIQRPLRQLEKAGVLVAQQPQTRPSTWRFLKYHELMAVVKKAWGRQEDVEL